MNEPTGRTLVFVYGTLLRGEPHHDLVARAHFLGAARTSADYQLVDMGEFPALVAPGECSVVGELYDLTAVQLESMDEFEDAPSYCRRGPIALDDGRTVQAYCVKPSLAAGCAAIRSGDWRAHRSVRGSASLR